MKILYLTLEHYLSQPIIQSQVVSLLQVVIKKVTGRATDNTINVQLATFETQEDELKIISHAGEDIFSHRMYKNRGTIKNLFKLCFDKDIFRNKAIIHVRSYLPMIPALWAKLRYGNKVIFDMRGVLPEETLLRKNNIFQFYLLRGLEWLACRCADHVVVVSQSFKHAVQKRSGIKEQKISVIPTFSKNEELPDNLPSSVPDIRNDIFKLPSARIFVYSGAFEKWQCSTEVVSFFKIAGNKFPDARFVVCSRNTSEFEALLAPWFEKKSYYIVNAPNVELVNYLRQCNYGLLFRRRHIINEVAAPIKFKDYLSAGLPVIITDGIGDYSEYVNRYKLGYILDEISDSSFEKVLSDISADHHYFDPAYIRSSSAKLFDVETAAAGYIELYKQLQSK